MNFGPATAGENATFSQWQCEEVFLCLDSTRTDRIITHQ